MTLTTIGTMSQFFITQRQNVEIRDRLNTLNEELSTGRASDLARHLGGDAGRLGQIDRRLGLIGSFSASGSRLAQMTATMQTGLDRIETSRSALSEELLRVTEASGPSQRETAVNSARAGFEEMVGTLNMRIGGEALFAGADAAGTALADADAMLDDLRAAIAGAAPATATDFRAVVETWFDDPAGGFATMGYTGDTGTAPERPIDSGTRITLDIRADATEIRDLLKATALAALAADPAATLSTEDRNAVLTEAGLELAAGAQGFAGLRGRLGATEARIETAMVRLEAEATALGQIRNDLVLKDPFETATALEQTRLQLETHYTVTARLAQLSFTEYLR